METLFFFFLNCKECDFFMTRDNVLDKFLIALEAIKFRLGDRSLFE